MLYLKLEFILYILSFIPLSYSLDPSDLVIVVLSQEEGFNAAQADLLKQKINLEANELEKVPPKIILSHTLDIYGAWTVVPVIAYLKNQEIESEWYIFCTEYTVIRLNKLLQILTKNNNLKKSMWIGHALYDEEPTIIHHYAENVKKFKYPNLASGFAISKQLFKSLARKAIDAVNSHVDFSVDASYEFAKFVFNESKGVRLTHEPEFCVVSNENCATYPKSFHPCSNLSIKQNAYFAVKTCSKFHEERLPVINQTWAKYAENIGYFTDKLDKNLIDGHVVPKTEQGHCSKTYAILKYAAPILKEKNLDWLIIADDDTLLSVSRLLKLLTCYNPKNTIALGERYGYRTTKIHGYDYLTGGSGVVLSAALVEQIVKPGTCECPSATTPDDMFLFGVCLAHLGVKVTHSSQFHQARPVDYATAFLASQEPISFHKFWMLDPNQVYKEWFEEVDQATFSFQNNNEHIEL